MTVLIKVDQAAHPAGVPGQAREDLATGVGVTLTAVGGPFLAYQWSIVSKPIDILTSTEASSLLASPTANITTLSPIDVAGTYLVQVSVDSGNGLGAGAGDVSRITFYAGPTLAVSPIDLPRRRMAAFESTEHNVPDAIQPLGNTQGWSREWYRWFAAIEASVALTRAATSSATPSTLALRNSTGEVEATGLVVGPFRLRAASVITTDATPTILVSIPFGDDSVFTGKISAMALSPGVGLFQAENDGGVFVTAAGVLQPQLGAPTVNSYNSGGPFAAVSIAVVYSNVTKLLSIEVTGVALTTITWTGSIEGLVIN